MTTAIIVALAISGFLLALLLWSMVNPATDPDEEKLEAYIEYLERRVMELESLNIKYRHEAGYMIMKGSQDE